MAAKKIQKSDSKSRVRTSTRKQEVIAPKSSFFDYFRFSESYTSLILGIIVVIIGSVLLISFAKNRSGVHQPVQDISSTKIVVNNGADQSVQQPVITQEAVTKQPTPTIVKSTPTTVPTATVIPTRIPTPTKSEPTITPVVTQSIKQNATGRTYTVKSGDDLWAIAQKTYNDGYQWVKIAEANHLTNPQVIHAGNVLQLPTISQNIATAPNTNQPGNSVMSGTSNTQSSRIVGTTYTVQKGDCLWDIAQRAFNGDGYKWVEIAKANNMQDPDMIYSGTVLRLPRT